MKTEIYRGYLIEPQYIYSDGTIDFHVFPQEGNEEGFMVHKKSIEYVYEHIDEILDEADIVWRACMSGFIEANDI